MHPVLALSGGSVTWYVARATGVVTLGFLTASVLLGILTSFRWSSPTWPRFVVEFVHRNVSLLVLVFLWGTIGLNIVIYLAALQDVPTDVIEAARVDGAGRWATFRHVILPALLPVTIFQVIWSLITALQFFDLLVTNTQGGPAGKTSSLVYLLYEVAFRRTHRYGYGAAIAVTLSVVSLALAAVLFVRMRRSGEAIA